MTAKVLIPAVILAATLAPWTQLPARGQTAMLPAPGFHHLHLNSADPDAAIGFYTRQFPTTSKATWGGFPALKSPNNAMVLFTKVATTPPAPPLASQTAIWHFGFHVTDSRKTIETFKSRPEVKLLPLYTSDEGGSVLINSDTWPGTGGVLGLTRAQIAEARAKGVKPVGGGGFAYLQGPDGVIVEYVGNQPVERMNHVHMYQEDPFCAQIWYQKHLNAPLFAGRAPPTPMTEANCKVARTPDRSWPALEKEGTFRVPTAAVMFGDVALTWYMNQGDKPLVDTRGHLADHVALSVADLDAWIAKLRGEDVKFLSEPYKLGDTRAVMIEGPSREALELVEVK
jgi:catechol 2,3-dioxygenase-like lactoylglutathione lyase family enzyme